MGVAKGNEDLLEVVEQCAAEGDGRRHSGVADGYASEDLRRGLSVRRAGENAHGPRCAGRAAFKGGRAYRANKERGYPSVENFWNDLNKLLSDFYKVTVYKGRWVQYLEGLGMTIALAALACLIGVCIGVLVALGAILCRRQRRALAGERVNAACGIYVTVVRGTPIVVQLLIAYTILFNEPALRPACSPSACNSGAYVAEDVVRGGIASHRPWTGGGRAGALGLSRGARASASSSCCRRRSKIFCPRCSTSSLIALLKETSVAGYIAARDLTKVSDSMRGIACNSAPLFIAAAIYLLLVVGPEQPFRKKWNGGWRKVIEVKNLQKAFGGRYGAQGRDGDH